jgi:WD40 repeat protein
VHPKNVVFCPDGAFVLSCSFDGSIKFWDVQSGDRVNRVTVEGGDGGINISGVTGITAAQKTALRALDAVEKLLDSDDKLFWAPSKNKVSAR